jgi:glucose-1-phosphate cytidylyltransferase
MKAVILAGGLGTRISEETSTIPKPMIEIGGRPILWHIIKQYSYYGINDFIICLGYKGSAIKHYFAHYYLTKSDVTIDMRDNTSNYSANAADPWKVTLVDTGENSMTGGRLRRIRDYVKDDEAFCLTYGDGLSNVNIGESIEFHRKHGKLATVTAVQPTERFGLLDIQGDLVKKFKEKPKGDANYINGGFFVLSPKVLDLIEDDQTIWERAPLETLAHRGELAAYKHDGFWHCIDTLRDKQAAAELWDSGKAPWKIW